MYNIATMHRPHSTVNGRMTILRRLIDNLNLFLVLLCAILSHVTILKAKRRASVKANNFYFRPISVTREFVKAMS